MSLDTLDKITTELHAPPNAGETLALRMRRYRQSLEACPRVLMKGTVKQVTGLVIESAGPAGSIGDLCVLHDGRDHEVPAEIVGFRRDCVLLMPLGEIERLRPGCEVICAGSPLRVPVGRELLGRVVDGLGNPIDGKGPLRCTATRRVSGQAPNPLHRRPITDPMPTGIRAIDGLLTVGRGQRIGIFAAAGVGKSTLLGLIARRSGADVNVIGLIGERGREVREFIENFLGDDGLARSVVVVVTSDQHSLLRVKGAMTATAIAEHFRDQGQDVMLFIDSVTRVARAQRETGLSIGEPPAIRGYTPSTFALLPRLLERAGAAHAASITGVYTVLVEGDDMDEPVSDTVRAILDGHVVLSRKLAERGIYPAIDVLQSVSRVMPGVVDADHLKAALRFKEYYSVYEEARDLINLGAYARGSNPRIDKSIELIDNMVEFLRQDTGESTTWDDTRKSLAATAGG
ncbi:MAG TPA: FliI/YscN family ATPase [Planctomycetota bacterium]|nr:FliI/YscN family ATPase [Planctomycetota bacterium]